MIILNEPECDEGDVCRPMNDAELIGWCNQIDNLKELQEKVKKECPELLKKPKPVE